MGSFLIAHIEVIYSPLYYGLLLLAILLETIKREILMIASLAPSQKLRFYL